MDKLNNSWLDDLIVHSLNSAETERSVLTIGTFIKYGVEPEHVIDMLRELKANRSLDFKGEKDERT